MTDKTNNFMTGTERAYFASRGESAPNGRAEAGRKVEHTDEAVFRAWSNAVDEARREHGDIDAALEFLEQARLKQLSILAAADPRFADPAFCERQIAAELRAIVLASFQRGVNPAKAAYAMAAAYGFGRADAARIERLADAAKAARSLTAGGGGEAGDPYLPETVANMPEAEFAKWHAKNKGAFRRMFGG